MLLFEKPLSKCVVCAFSVSIVLCACTSLGADRQLHLLDRFGPPGKKTFAVLMRPEVQRDLLLSSEQIEKIVEIKSRNPKRIPAISNEIATAEPAATPEKRLQREYKIAGRIDSFREQNYYAILSAVQSNRLEQIMIQVRGLKVTLSKPLLAVVLSISPSQSNTFNQVITNYEPKLDPLYQRLHRQSLSGLSPGESLEKRSSEVTNLVDSICSIETARETELTAVLAPDQLSTWLKLKGVPLQIQWSYDNFVDLSD